MGRKTTRQQPKESSGQTDHNRPLTLEEAIAQRDLFLKRHPQYQPYQREIERILDKAGPSEKRMEVLALLMEGQIMEMNRQLQQLNKILVNVIS